MDRPEDLNNFVSALVDLEPWQKEFLEKLTKMKFEAIEQRVLANAVRPHLESDVFIACDWADGINHTAVAVAQLRGDGVIYFIDDMTNDVRARIVDFKNTLQTPFRLDGFIEELSKFEARLPPLAQEGPHEDHLHARRTKGKKKPLPFYHGNRRRF